MKNICVIGSDDYNLNFINEIAKEEDWKIHPVLTREDVQPASGHIDFDDLLGQACEAAEKIEGGPDGFVGDLDFPVTSLVSLLNKQFNTPGSTPEACARCEHKYWMRLEQKKVLPESTPDFCALNPFQPKEAMKDAPDFPFWMKPVKGHSSVLGFMVEDESGFKEALHESRQKVHLIGEPFNAFLRHVETPDELEHVDGNFMVAEGLISASRQFTLEGYVRKGETVIYGAVDSVRVGKHGSSFSRYQYPADLPDEIVERGREITDKFLKQIGYDGAPFNVEFFWDPEGDRLSLLEINPRISKSHSPLFKMVDGVSHHRVALDLALGHKPKMPRGKGKDDVAAKYMLRSFEEDGFIERTPTADEVSELKRILPDIDANVLVKKGTRLSDLFFQDSYSYELAEVFLGGSDEQMIEDSYLRCVDSLPIWIKPMPVNL